ncbi:hypothetical protein B7P43_G14968 [Cryptotermes secundus]|uniref:Uncharacterized protein n=1 Tax=Cryptotermes secundus TaxID=105785 RepID=A0A2J7RS83_9NEOP|nr:hypothetical protein B7P43_G14968 [Cryptotermes secundus]
MMKNKKSFENKSDDVQEEIKDEVIPEICKLNHIQSEKEIMRNQKFTNKR